MSLIDNFDSYNLGDLNGQGGWSGPTFFDVVNTQSFNSLHSVQAVIQSGNTGDISKSFSTLSAGVQTWYAKSTATNTRSIVVLSEDVFASINVIIYWNMNAGKFGYYGDGAVTDHADVVPNQWYKIDVEWRSTPDKKFRVRLDNGTWSVWRAPYAVWTTGLNLLTLDLFYNAIYSGTMYWDAFSDPTVAPASFVDTFNRADNAALGGTWVDNTGDFQIVSNAAKSISAPASSYDGQVMGTADYSVSASMAYHNTTGNPGYQWAFYLYARASGVTKFDNCYFAYISNNFGTDQTVSLYIGKKVAGATTYLLTNAKQPCTPGQTYAYKLEVYGSLIRIFKDGVAIAEVTDSTWTSEGDHGIRTDSTNIVLDNYVVDTAIAPLNNTGLDGQYVMVRPGGTVGQPYLSTDYGQTWAVETIIPGDNSQYWSSFGFSHDGTIIVAACLNNAGKKGRLYKKVSGTWLEMQPHGNSDLWWNGIAISGDGKKIIAIHTNGYSISQNAGSTWTNVPISGGASCAINRNGSKMMYVTSRLYYSNNSGSSFTELQPQGNVARTWGKPWMNLNGDKIVVYSASDSAGQGRVWYTNNEGSSWTEIRPFQNGLDIDRQWGGFVSNESMTRMLAGGPNYAYLWLYQEGVWVQQSPGGTINGAFTPIAGSYSMQLSMIGTSTNGRLRRMPYNYWVETRPIGDVDSYWPQVEISRDDGLFPTEVSYNVTSRARIMKYESKTAQAKARIKYTGVTKTVTAKAHVHNYVAAGYSHFMNLSVDYTKVWNSDHTNFPVLVKGTYTHMKLVANGGHVESVNGYDIIFTTTDAFYRLDHDLEFYDPVTGEFAFWVKIPTLSSTVNTEFRMYYGNPTVVAPTETPTVVWNDYKAVWHLNDTSDSTSNSNTLTNTGVTLGVPGQADGAGDFESSEVDYMRAANNASLNTTGAFTVSGWVKPESFPANYSVMYYKAISDGFGDALYKTIDLGYLPTNVYVVMAQNSTNYAARPWGSALTAGNWYHIVGTWNGVNSSGLNLYVNGVKSTQALEGAGNVTSIQTSTAPVTLGGKAIIGGGTDRLVDGVMDEVRLQWITRSDGWIKTEYYNATDPGFITYSGEHISINVTVTARARIQNTSTRTATSKARIKYTGVTKNVTAKAKISPPGGQMHIMGDDCLVY